MHPKTTFQLSTAAVLSSLILLIFLVGISIEAQPALAAPASPDPAEYPATVTITPTKQANPGPLVGPGQVVTYSVTFTADDAPGTVLITDAVPLSTTYQSGSITATGSSGVVISAATLSNSLVWTATNVTTGSQVTARFAVTVSQGATPGAPIANTAWLTDGTRLYSTTTTITTTNPAITLTKTASKDTVTIGQPVAYMYRITNTGNVTLAVQLVDDKLGPLTPAKTTLGPTENTTASHTVQAVDRLGPLTNTATVTGTPQIGDGLVTAQARAVVTVEEAKIYLPVIIKPPPTDLTVVAINTNGITYLRIGPQSAPVCEVTQVIPDCDPNSCNNPANKPCPLFQAGNYDVVATTNRCGTLAASNRYFEPGPHIITIFCN